MHSLCMRGHIEPFKRSALHNKEVPVGCLHRGLLDTHSPNQPPRGRLPRINLLLHLSNTGNSPLNHCLNRPLFIQSFCAWIDSFPSRCALSVLDPLLLAPVELHLVGKLVYFFSCVAANLALYNAASLVYITNLSRCTALKRYLTWLSQFT